MPTIPAETILTQLRWRYATKKFDPTRKIPAAIWEALEQILLLSPSSYGLQPYRFIVAADPGLRQQLRAASWDQAQVTDASHFVVFARKLDLAEADVDQFVNLTTDTRGMARGSLQGYRDVMVGDLVHGPRHGIIREWTARQTYIALGNLLTAAALLGIDACPMEGFDPARYDGILGLTAKGYGATNACALGYRAADDKYAAAKKVRLAAADLIEHR